MTPWYIYLCEKIDPESKEKYKERRYYRKRLKKPPNYLTYVGRAELNDNYFITGSETKFTEITNLNEVSLEFSATMKNERISTFEHTVQELIERAKEGMLCYLSFKGYKVSKKPILKIHGQKTLTNTKLKIWTL